MVKIMKEKEREREREIIQDSYGPQTHTYIFSHSVAFS